MPNRVLPVSPKPPRDFGLILDAEFGEIAKMAYPGHNRRARKPQHVGEITKRARVTEPEPL